MQVQLRLHARNFFGVVTPVVQSIGWRINSAGGWLIDHWRYSVLLFAISGLPLIGSYHEPYSSIHFGELSEPIRAPALHLKFALMMALFAVLLFLGISSIVRRPSRHPTQWKSWMWLLRVPSIIVVALIGLTVLSVLTADHVLELQVSSFISKLRFEGDMRYGMQAMLVVGRMSNFHDGHQALQALYVLFVITEIYYAVVLVALRIGVAGIKVLYQRLVSWGWRLLAALFPWFRGLVLAGGVLWFASVLLGTWLHSGESISSLFSTKSPALPTFPLAGSPSSLQS